MQNIKAGLIGIGLNTYWEQFDGLLDRLRSYQDSIKERITSYGHITVIDGGMVDDIEKAIRIASLMKTQEVQILYIFISTYALSSTVLPIVNWLAIPVILLNVQPLPAIDY